MTAAGQCGLCFTQEFLLQNAAACPGPPQPLLFSFDADSQSFRRSTTRGRRFCKNGNFSVSFKQKAVLLKRSFLSRSDPAGTRFLSRHRAGYDSARQKVFMVHSRSAEPPNPAKAPAGHPGCPPSAPAKADGLCAVSPSYQLPH